MAMRTIYRQSGTGKFLYKIRPEGQALEINLESYAYGIISVTHVKKDSIWNAPGPKAKPIRKAVFDQYFREAMQRIKSV